MPFYALNKVGISKELKQFQGSSPLHTKTTDGQTALGTAPTRTLLQTNCKLIVLITLPNNVFIVLDPNGGRSRCRVWCFTFRQIRSTLLPTGPPFFQPLINKTSFWPCNAWPTNSTTTTTICRVTSHGDQQNLHQETHPL